MKASSTMRFYLVAIILACFVSCQRAILVSDINPVYSSKLIKENGGRISWYSGNLHSKVLFDRVTNSLSRSTDVFMMEPDGTEVECLTCDIKSISKRFIGQPVWHPDGVHCIIQVENDNSNHTRYEHVSFGLNNDLYLLNTVSKEIEKIFTTALNDAALHPQFNKRGDKLIFSRRIATGKSFPRLEGVTPGGENHWDGWNIQICDFDINKRGENMISNVDLIRPNGRGFYETHAIDQKIIYSYTPNGKAYVDDCYACNLDGENKVNLTDSKNTWEEHATFSPSQKHMAFISSRHDGEWTYPKKNTKTINTELYLKNTINDKIEQITNFNSTQNDYRILTSDFDWSSDGKSIIFLVAKIHKRNILLTSNEIWRIDFDEAK